MPDLDISIAVAEDHAMVRQGMKLVISREIGMRWVGEAGDGEAALELVRRLQPDVLLLDLGLPRLDGLDVMRAISAHQLRTRVLVVTARQDPVSVRTALAFGAHGYLLKTDDADALVAALHTVDPMAIGLEGYGKPGNYFERQIGRWSKQYLASSTEEIAEMNRLIEWLPANMPAGARDAGKPTVVHGDYRLDNLVFHPSEPRVIGVLDWELSTLGHPLADFSYHCMSWHIAPGSFRGIGGLDHAALGIPAEADYIERYCARTGRADVPSLKAEWNFYLAYNLFRLASIMQGIAKRVVDGTASSAQARASGAATRSLAQMAWTFAQAHEHGAR